MRIAVYHNLPSGGAKRSLLEAVRRLVPRHQVDVYTLSCANHEFADLRPWVADHRVTPFEPLRMFSSPFGRVNQALRRADLSRLDRLSRQMARQIDEGSYDVALVHPCQISQSPSLLQYLHRTRTVYYCHEPLRLVHEGMPARPYDDSATSRRRLLNRLDPLPGMYARALRDLDRANTRRADLVLVNSTFTARSVARIYDVGPKVSYHGVDAERFAPQTTTRQPYVLSVGSLTPLKGFDFLVRAMAQYRGRTRPALVIASNFQNPPERSYLERLARDHGVDLSLVGNVTDPDLVRLYNQAQAVVYSPVREPFGLVPLEAMACATPVVAVAEGGVPESVVDGQTGILTDRDPGAFADAIQQLIDDPERARRLGENGRDHVLARWTWEHAVASLERHLAGQASDTAVEDGPPVRMPASITSAPLG